MRILFVRHGQTTGDIEDRYGGDYDDALSPLGQTQSQSLSEELKEKPIELIISSPLLRARETAAIISRQTIPIVIEKDFKERNQYGMLTGQIKSDAKQTHPDLYEAVKDRLNTIDGAESYEDFRRRIHEAFDRLTTQTTQACVAVIWHGGPMRVLFRDILKKGELEEIGDCAWVELAKEGNDFQIQDSKRITFQFEHFDV